MKMKLRLAVILLTMFACVGCDQVTKSVARDRLPAGETFSMLADTVRLQYSENPGAFLSLGHNLTPSVRRALFTFGATLLVAAAIIWTFSSRRLSMPQTIGAAMISAGGLGNLIDRLTRDGLVTDFLNIGVGMVRTGIFNVADMALTFGVALVILANWPQGRGLPG
jgi:signal peptidase II